MKECDLLVIGGGSGGVRAARLAAACGARVILAEQGALGGTCVNVGCVPKKLFVYAASFSEDAEAAAGSGWTAAACGDMHWQTLRDNKNAEIARLNKVYATLLQDAGVEMLSQRAVLCGAQMAQVGEHTVHAKHILLATGAAPVRPNLPGAELGVLSDDMFFLPELPRRAAVLGGGYIALEFAGILAGLGVETTLCYRADLPMRGVDDDLRAHLAAEIEKRGVRLQSGVAPTGLEKNGAGRRLLLDGGLTVDADLILLATGRKPNFADLGLEHANVSPDKKGHLSVNGNYQTECPWLYAIGDLLPTPALTPVATAEAMVFVSRVFGGDAVPDIDYGCIPTAVFSRPPLATVGLGEAAARQKGHRVRVYKSEFKAMKKTLSGKDWRSVMKIVVDADDERVLGVHLIGDDAGEIIQGFAVALRLGARKADFDATIGVHPTSAEELVTMRVAAD